MSERLTWLVIVLILVGTFVVLAVMSNNVSNGGAPLGNLTGAVGTIVSWGFGIFMTICLIKYCISD